MKLDYLGVRNLRNIKEARIYPDAKVNLIVGTNGAGKTSLLEAIMLLGRGKGFRGAKQGSVIADGCEQVEVKGRMKNGAGKRINVVKKRSETRIEINSRPVKRLTELATEVPLRLLSENSQALLNSDPIFRRRFLDWNLFHVEPGYWDLQERFKRCLNQRNAWLKQGGRGREVWDPEFVELSNNITRKRRLLVVDLGKSLEKLSQDIPDMQGMDMGFYQGWRDGEDLRLVLGINKEKEVERGYTLVGPQRADFSVVHRRNRKKAILSHGQVKIAVYLLQESAELIQQRRTNKESIFLVDDLSAEFDQTIRRKMFRYLLSMGCQIFITALEHVIEDVNCSEIQVFHVEHGRIHR